MGRRLSAVKLEISPPMASFARMNQYVGKNLPNDSTDLLMIDWGYEHTTQEGHAKSDDVDRSRLCAITLHGAAHEKTYARTHRCECQRVEGIQPC